ncbi:MAG: hypothetical protein JWN48_2707 [Myxococcaceae bacterium]|nr:hypothetical protein [Myxococcaceae bacterium]
MTERHQTGWFCGLGVAKGADRAATTLGPVPGLGRFLRERRYPPGVAVELGLRRARPCPYNKSMLRDRDLISSDQLRHAADLLDKARGTSSRAEVLALLGSAREICQRVSGELADVLDPAGHVVDDALDGVRRRLSK